MIGVARMMAQEGSVLAMASREENPCQIAKLSIASAMPRRPMRSTLLIMAWHEKRITMAWRAHAATGARGAQNSITKMLAKAVRHSTAKRAGESATVRAAPMSSTRPTRTTMEIK